MTHEPDVALRASHILRMRDGRVEEIEIRDRAKEIDARAAAAASSLREGEGTPA